MFNLGAWIPLYIIEVLPVFVIAKKSAHEYAWLAFVPIANFWLLCDMADLEAWFIILWLVPYVDVLFFGVICWRIAENANKSDWIGLERKSGRARRRYGTARRHTCG